MDSQGPDRQVSGPRQRVIKLSWLWQYEDGLSNRGDASDQLLHTAAGAPAEITTPLPSSQPESQDVTPTRDSVIVFLDHGPAGTVAERASVILERAGIPGRPGLIYDQLNGFVLPATDDQARRLRSVDGVSSVERDAEIFLEPPIEDDLPRSSSQPPSAETQALVSYGNGRAASGEVLPWGVQAVWQGQDVSRRGNFASDSYAFVIDSGVLATTGDLNLASNSSWHRSWVPGETPFTDGSGHGTHVAGTIAALANGVGVVGVAPGAQVVSLKVFNSSGTGGSYSSIIEAVNHAVSVINTNGLDKSKVVINMSLGGGYSSSLDTALRNAANQGIRIVVAAGNSGADADSFSPHPLVTTPIYLLFLLSIVSTGCPPGRIGTELPAPTVWTTWISPRLA